MTTPYKNDYAFGLMVTTKDGRKEIDHGGGIQGFNTEVAYWPDDQLAIIVLANLNGDAPPEIASELGATIHGEKVTLPSERKEITLSPEALAQYVGTYTLAPKVDLSIITAGDHLETQLTGQPKFPIYAESPDHFFLKVVDAQLEFGRDAAGKVTQVTLHQNGRSIVCPRK